MKKKLLALTLVFGLALSLAACSGGTQPGTADTPAPATDSPVPATGSRPRRATWPTSRTRAASSSAIRCTSL